MKKIISPRRLFIAALTLPLFAGCMSPPPVNVAPQVAPGDGANAGPPTQPPPAAQKDIIPIAPGPRTLYWFIPGHWEWRGQYVWVAGHWRSRPHPGDIWLPGKWVPQNNPTNSIYVWQGGHWRSEAPADKESMDK